MLPPGWRTFVKGWLLGSFIYSFLVVFSYREPGPSDRRQFVHAVEIVLVLLTANLPILYLLTRIGGKTGTTFREQFKIFGGSAAVATVGLLV